MTAFCGPRQGTKLLQIGDSNPSRTYPTPFPRTAILPITRHGEQTTKASSESRGAHTSDGVAAVPAYPLRSEDLRCARELCLGSTPIATPTPSNIHSNYSNQRSNPPSHPITK